LILLEKVKASENMHI